MAISDKLAKIKRQAAELNAKSDAFNATIAHVEEGLRGSGVEFWWEDGRLLGMRTFRGEDEERHREYFVLGYTRPGTEWCIAVQRYTGVWMGQDEWEDTRDGDPTPLRRAARLIRIDAAAHLEEFLESLSAAISAMSKAIDKANALASGEMDKMDVLREALKAGRRVEIHRNIGMGSATFSVAQESARAAAEANARGERTACIIDDEDEYGGAEYECGVDADQVRELIRLGAVEA